MSRWTENFFVDFAADYVREKAGFKYEPDKVKSYSTQAQRTEKHLEPKHKRLYHWKNGLDKIWLIPLKFVATMLGNSKI